MSKHARIIEIDRASVDADAGTFEAVVFTDGEATDGHILNIRGGSVPAKMPLFVNHHADPRTQLGSLYRKDVNDHQVVMRGEIFLGGEGPEAEVRRDLLAKMAAGHVSRMSGRWDAEDANALRRTQLDKKHPAYVNEKKAERDFRFRYGYFFDKWRALEGSVVGLGADPDATMRFAQDPESTEAVRHFWRDQIDPEREWRPDPGGFDSKEAFLDACIPQAIEEGNTQEQAVAMCTSMWENREIVNPESREETPESDIEERVRNLVEKALEREISAPPPVVPPAESTPTETPSGLSAALAAQLREFEARGLSAEDFHAVLRESAYHVEPQTVNIEIQPPAPETTPEPEADSMTSRFAEMERQLQETRDELDAKIASIARIESIPETASPKALILQIKRELEEERKRAVQQFKDYIAYKRGERVQGDERLRTIREIRALVEARATKERVPAEPLPAPPRGTRVIAESIRGLSKNSRNTLLEYLSRQEATDSTEE